MKDPVIEIKNLTVSNRDKTILKNVSLDIYSGEITLLVGGSGAGKSVLMKILAGLITPADPHFEISGSIKILGKDILSWKNMSKSNSIGFVFQDYGLFDEYSIKQNLDFAFSHSPFKIPRQQRENMRTRLFKKLELDSELSIRHASGGQKRRIAIARTLAYNPEIIIYDEPTSGLDPHMSQSVAKLIRNTHEIFGKKGSIVVTHEYEDFLDLSDRIIFLDSEKKKLKEITPIELGKGSFHVPHFEKQKVQLKDKLRSMGIHFFTATTSYILKLMAMIFVSIFRIIPSWHSPIWGLRFLFHYSRIVFFLSSAVYVSMAGAIIGFVSAYFTFSFLPYARFTKPLIIEEVLGAVGYGLFRIIIPILTAILISARCGAAITSDVGNKTYLQEIDAIKSLGASVSSYLQTGIVYAFILGVPLLTFLTFLLQNLYAFGFFFLCILTIILLLQMLYSTVF